MKLVQEVVRTVRSMKQDYLPPKARPEGTVESGLRNKLYVSNCNGFALGTWSTPFVGS